MKVVLTLCLLFLFPDDCQALQSHGAPEGLYVHQMAHIFFIVGLIYLYWDIKRSAFKSPGWRCLRIFCLLMLSWNVVAFVGHFAGGYIDADHIYKADGYLYSRIVGPLTITKITYYLAKFDHIIAVPALFFLYLAMRTLHRSTEQEEGGTGK